MASRIARPGEFVRAVRVPKLGADEHFRCYKISKRFDQDISAVMGAFKFALDGTRIARRAHRLRRHGGDAEARKRSREGADRRRDLRPPATGSRRSRRSAQDFTPIDDLRASAQLSRATSRARCCARR